VLGEGGKGAGHGAGGRCMGRGGRYLRTELITTTGKVGYIDVNAAKTATTAVSVSELTTRPIPLTHTHTHTHTFTLTHTHTHTFSQFLYFRSPDPLFPTLLERRAFAMCLTVQSSYLCLKILFFLFCLL